MKWSGDKTIVTANGEVLYQPPTTPQGLMVVSEMHEKPILKIGEVSDETTVNFFIDLFHPARLLRTRPFNDVGDNHYEVLAMVKKLDTK